MIADRDLIRLIATLYPSPDPGTGPLPPIVSTITTALGTAGIVHHENTAYVLFPGSKTFVDWYSDLDAVGVWMGESLGVVHAGFMAGPLTMKARLDSILGDSPVVLAGHSLGAAHALDYAALRLLERKPVAKIVTFGSPMPGCKAMRDFLAGVPITNYRNLDDPVTTVPFPVPLVFPCLQMRVFTDIHGEPDAGDTSEFKAHHSWCYYRGLTAITGG